MGNYLTFSSPSDFSLHTRNNAKNWNGTLEYSTDANAWNVWDGTTYLGSDNGKLYLRGTGNTKISGGSNNTNCWILVGTDISCEGNIETLLDYAMVANGEHPPMITYCFSYLFDSNKNLITAPELPATTLADCCYEAMFFECTSLVNAPALPATTLAYRCYGAMFFGCTSLVSLPALPATSMTMYCYTQMFDGCSNIKLSAIQTEEYCNEYRIPTSGDGTKATFAFYLMLKNTGGTFTGDPSINTTYYTANEVIFYEPEPEEPTATVITYNGETIATLEAGQTATIKTAETEVEHDIVITPVFPIEIAYGDIIATAEAGQTATVKCANTEMEHDIVVSAKAEEDDSIVGTWVFNETIDMSTEFSIEAESPFASAEYEGIDLSAVSTIKMWDGIYVISKGQSSWLYYNGNWKPKASKTFIVTDISEIANHTDFEIFATWLKANATKQ